MPVPRSGDWRANGSGSRPYQQGMGYHGTKDAPAQIIKKSVKFEEAGNIKEAMNVTIAYLDELTRKNDYNPDFDKMMENFNRLCVKAKNSRMLNQGMFLYRRFCFNRYPEAIERVLEDLMTRVKTAFEQAKESLKDIKLPKDSLEVDTDMDYLICNAFSGADAEALYNETADEAKFYYDSLRVVFDTLRFQIESKVYTEAVMSLIQFCQNYQRPNELRAIAEQFYSHIQKASQDGVDITPVTGVRFKFAEVCYETEHLELALKALAGSESSLVNTNNVVNRATCQEMLAKIYLKTHNYLLHAQALFKQYNIIQQNKNNIEEFAEIATSKMIDSLICAVLSIPFEQDNTVNTAKAALFTSIDADPYILENADKNLSSLYTLMCRCTIRIPSNLARKEISKYLANIKEKAKTDEHMKNNYAVYGGLICKAAFSYVVSCSSKKCSSNIITSELLNQMYKEIFGTECKTLEQRNYIHQAIVNLIYNKILPSTISIKDGKVSVEITNKKDVKKLITDESDNYDNYTNAIERYVMRGVKISRQQDNMNEAIRQIREKMKKLLDIQEEIFENNRRAAQQKNEAQLAAELERKKLQEAKDALSTDIMSSTSSNSVERITPFEKRQMQIDSFYFDKQTLLSNPMNAIIKDKLNNDALNSVLVAGYNKSVDSPMIQRLGIDVTELLQDFDDGKYVSPYLFLEKLMSKIIAERESFYKASQEMDHDMKIFLERSYKRNTSIAVKDAEGNTTYRSAIVDVNNIIRTIESNTGIFQQRAKHNESEQEGKKEDNDEQMKEETAEEKDYSKTNKRYEEFVKYCENQHKTLLKLREQYKDEGNVFVTAFEKMKTDSEKRQKKEFEKKDKEFREKYDAAAEEIKAEKMEQMRQAEFERRLKEYKDKLERQNSVRSRFNTEANEVGSYRRGKGKSSGGSSSGSAERSGFGTQVNRGSFSDRPSLDFRNQEQPSRRSALSNHESIRASASQPTRTLNSNSGSIADLYGGAAVTQTTNTSSSTQKKGFSFGGNAASNTGSASEPGKFRRSTERTNDDNNNENNNNVNENNEAEKNEDAGLAVLRRAGTEAAQVGKFAARRAMAGSSEGGSTSTGGAFNFRNAQRHEESGASSNTFNARQQQDSQITRNSSSTISERANNPELSKEGSFAARMRMKREANRESADNSANTTQQNPVKMTTPGQSMGGSTSSNTTSSSGGKKFVFGGGPRK